MATPYFINVPKLRKWPYATGAHTHVKTVKAHKRRVNPKKQARPKISTASRTANRAKRATRRRRKFSPAQIAAQKKFIAMVRARQAQRAAATTPTRRTGGTSMARKKRRRSAAHRSNPHRRRRRRRNPVRRLRAARRHRRNPVMRHRRRHRRNPSFGGRGIVRQIMQGAQDGLAVTLGSGVTNFVASKIPFGQSTTVGQGATQLLVGTLLGPVVKKLTRSDRAASMFVAGAYSNVIRTALAKTPLQPFLGVYVQPQLGTYVQMPRRLQGWAGGASAPGAALFNQVEQGNAYDDAASDAVQDFAA